MLIHVDTPVGVGIARQLANQEVAQEGGQIQILTPLLFHQIEVVLDVLALFRLNLILIGRLNGNRIPLIRIKVGFLLVSIGINLYQISPCQSRTADVLGSHLLDVHTVFVYLHLITQLVAALIFTIQQHIDSPSVGRVRHAHTAAQLKSNQIAHQRLVTVVVDERPLLSLPRSTGHQLFLVELDTVRLLGEIARGIATFTSGAGF